MPVHPIISMFRYVSAGNWTKPVYLLQVAHREGKVNSNQ